MNVDLYLKLFILNTIGTKKKSTSLRLNSIFYAHIEKLAKQENRSLNNFIETLFLKL